MSNDLFSCINSCQKKCNNILKAKCFFCENQTLLWETICRSFNNTNNNLSLVVMMIINENSFLINNLCFNSSFIHVHKMTKNDLFFMWHEDYSSFIHITSTIVNRRRFLSNQFLSKRFIVVVIVYNRFLTMFMSKTRINLCVIKFFIKLNIIVVFNKIRIVSNDEKKQFFN